MPFSFSGALSGLAGGWDDPSIAARHLFKKKEDKYRQELEDESFKKRLTTAYNQERTEEGDTLDDIARAAVIGGEVDPVTNAPITQGAAYRKALQTMGEAKEAQPLEAAYKTRMTTAMMPEAAETGKAESKAGIAERMKRASTALLGSEEAESERGEATSKRIDAIKRGYDRASVGHALQRDTDVQRIIQGAPASTARREVAADEDATSKYKARETTNIPWLESAADAARLEESATTARNNMTLGVPGKEAAARVSQAEFAEQEARQRRITGRLEPSEMEKQRAANAEYDRVNTESRTRLLEKPALAEKFATAARMAPNKVPEFLSDEELGYYMFLKNTGALDAFIQINSGVYRPGIYNSMTTATWGGSRTPVIDPELMSEFGLSH